MLKSYQRYLLNLLQLSGRPPDFYHAKHLIIDGSAQIFWEKFPFLWIAATKKGKNVIHSSPME